MRRRNRLRVARIAFEAGQSALRPVVARIERQHPPVVARGSLELLRAALVVAAGDELLNRDIALRLQIEPEGHVARVVVGGLLQQSDSTLVVTALDGCEALAMHPVRRAPREQNPEQNHCHIARVAACMPHGAPPVMSCCCWLRGLYVKMSAPFVNASTL